MGRLENKTALITGAAWGIGAAGYALGLALSTATDLPSGPVIVWMLAALAVATGLWRNHAPAPAAKSSA